MCHDMQHIDSSTFALNKSHSQSAAHCVEKGYEVYYIKDSPKLNGVQMDVTNLFQKGSVCIHASKFEITGLRVSYWMPLIKLIRLHTGKNNLKDL